MRTQIYYNCVHKNNYLIFIENGLKIFSKKQRRVEKHFLIFSTSFPFNPSKSTLSTFARKIFKSLFRSNKEEKLSLSKTTGSTCKHANLAYSLKSRISHSCIFFKTISHSFFEKRIFFTISRRLPATSNVNGRPLFAFLCSIL